MSNTKPIRVFEEDVKRLDALKIHPRETPADVLKRVLDERRLSRNEN